MGLAESTCTQLSGVEVQAMCLIWHFLSQAAPQINSEPAPNNQKSFFGDTKADNPYFMHNTCKETMTFVGAYLS